MNEAACWLPRDVGGRTLAGDPTLTPYGYRFDASERDGKDRVTLTVLRISESALRADLVARVSRAAGHAHVNVVRMRGAGEDGALAWIVHDRFDAMDLSAWQASHQRPLTEVSTRLELLRQVAAGLSFLHVVGLVHGRLAPESILVADDGGVRLMDAGLFPLAAHRRRQQLQGFDAQAPAESSIHAAPEAATARDASPPADCYSYGVIAYHLLAGQLPRGRFKSLVAIVPGCPAGVSRCVDRCLEAASGDRPSAGQIVLSHGDATWGAERSAAATLANAVDRLRGLATRFVKPHSGTPADSAVTSANPGLARRIAWEAFSFSLIGLLLGHVLGVVGGTLLMAGGLSAATAVGLHNVLFICSGLLALAAGLWRERSLAFLKSSAAGRSLLGLITAAGDYRDPRHKAADALRMIDTVAHPGSLPLDALRHLLESADEATVALERSVLDPRFLPPAHARLVDARKMILQAAAEKATAERQYGIARELYKRLAEARPDDAQIAARARQLTDVLERHSRRIEALLADGRLDDASRRIQGLAKHFPHDDTIQELRNRYEVRHQLLEKAKAESVDDLVRDNRWHHIGQIIDGLSAHNLPPGRFGAVVEACTSRRAAFARTREEAEVALRRLGARRASAWLERLRATISDDPFVNEFATRIADLEATRNRLRSEMESLTAKGRWLAADSSLRSFLLQHGIGSVSLLDAAQQLASPVLAAWARWRLLSWFVIAGAGFLAFAMLFSTASWHDASTAWSQRLPIQSRWLEIVGPGLVRGLQFLAAGVFMSVVLTLFGRPSIVFVPVFISLAIVVIVANAVPHAWAALQATITTPLPDFVQSAVAAIPGLIDTLAWLALFAAAAARAAHAATRGPTLMAAAVAVASLQAIHRSQAWAALLPESFATAALLAIAGVIGSARAWLLISLAGVVASILATTAPLSQQPDLLRRTVPAAVALACTGAFVMGTRRRTDVAWLVAAVAFACVTSWFIRRLHSAEILSTFTIWMIACGGVALANHGQLGGWVNPFDVCRAYWFRACCRRTPYQGLVLADTAWCRDNRAWHAAFQQRSAAAATAQRPRQQPTRTREG